MKPLAKPFVISGLCLAIAGCNMPARDPGFVARANGGGPVQSYALGQPDAPVPAEAMVLLPPEAGGVLRVRERHFRNGTRQEIILAGAVSGENLLDVSLRTSGGDNAPRGDLQIGKPSQRGIASEAQARFPGVKMHAVTRPMSNAFGPFGLAIGRRANGERCVFAWQWIDDLRSAANGSRSPLASMLSGGAAPASVRVRMCRANMTLDEMASFMEGLRPVPAAVERVVRMDRRLVTSEGAAPLGHGAGGAVGAALTTPMGGSLEAALPGAPSPAQRVVAAPPLPPKLAAARPPSRATRATAPARLRQTRPEPARYQPERHQPDAGPRYLAPLDGAAATGPGPVASSAPYGTTRLDSSLPSRAYLGPGAGI